MTHRTLLRRLCALSLSLMLLLCGAPAALADGTQPLESELIRQAEATFSSDDTQSGMYSSMHWQSIAQTLPARFDLRQSGVVREPSNQLSWGTCWGFASIGASEISILSALGMTVDSFLETYGTPLRLSERHLAWFVHSHLPDLSDFPDGQYIYPGLEGQAGEGERMAEETMAAHFSGATVMYASSVFASGVGPRMATEYPYTANDGTTSTASDWSIPEEGRFGFAFALEHSAILPSPAQRDQDGAYRYEQAGTEAIKSELLAGRAVTIAYHADTAMDPKAQENKIRDALAKYDLVLSDAQFDLLIGFTRGQVRLSDVPDEAEALTVLRAFFVTQGYDPAVITDDKLRDALANVIEAEEAVARSADEAQDEAADAQDDAAEQKARELAAQLGLDYDEYLQQCERQAAADAVSYVNTETYAQCTDSVDAGPDHAVTIIGWDDDYAVSNFLPDHQPPAPGAWIVRNSWGTDYGVDGYFYLSYYDRSITSPESFTYAAVDVNEHPASCDIMAYDFMPASEVSSVQLAQRAVTANVFTLEEDRVLSDVSVLTADLDAAVTINVYLLNENAASPVDGVMLDTVTTTQRFGGYHRIPLNHHFEAPAGARISVVQTQRVQSGEDTRFIVPYTQGSGEGIVEIYNTLNYQSGGMDSWMQACVNPGESFVCVDGEWTDWADVLGRVQQASMLAACNAYDNLNIKLYSYPTGEIEALHALGDPEDFNGAQVRICKDCGYAVVTQR